MTGDEIKCKEQSDTATLSELIRNSEIDLFF